MMDCATILKGSWWDRRKSGNNTAHPYWWKIFLSLSTLVFTLFFYFQLRTMGLGFFHETYFTLFQIMQQQERVYF